MARAEYHLRVADEINAKTDFVDWAVVALFYSALHYAHSMLADEPDLPKDERHPRKHSSSGKAGTGGRGLNQLVRDVYGALHLEYRSLFEASLRTRYDFSKLGTDAYPRLAEQHEKVQTYARMIHMTREPRDD